jgi:hypothetical protein
MRVLVGEPSNALLEPSNGLIAVVPPAAPDIGGAMLSMLSGKELETSMGDQRVAVQDRALAVSRRRDERGSKPVGR